MPKSLFPAASPDTRARLEQDPTVKLFNEYDWLSNPLGPIPGWPESLKGAVRTMVVATTPMVMMVGIDGVLLYNDAFARFAGERHPAIFGMKAGQAWGEFDQFSEDNIARGLRGESWMVHDQELTLSRYGFPETVWVDLNCSPIVGDDGHAMGTLCIVRETTDRILAEQAVARNEERLSLALSSSSLVGTWDWHMLDDVVTADDQFAKMFGIEPLRAGLGVPVQTFFSAVHPDDIDDVKAEIRRSTEALDEFRCECRVLSDNGAIKWIVAAGLPRRNAAGVVYRFPGVAIDVTEQHRTAEALAESELRFRTLADTMPQRVWTARPDGKIDYANARWYEFTGHGDVAAEGQEWSALIHPDERLMVRDAWHEALASKAAFQAEYRMRHHSGDYRWSLSRALPVIDGSGQLVRWIGTSTDVHDSRRAAEERELVAQELSHRIKNIFAVLNGIISLSARSQPEVKSFADQLRQRVYALGEAHDFVRPHGYLGGSTNGQGDLSALIERLVRPYNSDGASRVRFEGDDARVDDAAATPMALLFHELATNSAKYGALSAQGGLVTISGRNRDGRYDLVWQETGGPQVSEPHELGGFGTRLVQLSVEGQMRGQLERRWDQDGLSVHVSLPADALSRSDRLRGKSTL